MLLFYDGWDHYTTLSRKGWVTTGSIAVSSGNGRNGTASLRTSGNNQYVTRALPANYATLICGFALKVDNVSGIQPSDYQLQLLDSSTVQVALNLTSSGQVQVYRGTTLLGTASVSVTSGTFYYYELKTTISATIGTIDLYINGTKVLSLTGQNTNASGNAYVNALRLGFVGTASSPQPVHDYDDLYVCDTSGSNNNDVLGPVRVVTTLPASAGTYAQFTPSAGSNFENVDDNPPDDDTTYNSATVSGLIDTYTLSTLTTSGTILAVQSNLMVRSAGSGGELIRPKIRISGVNYNGTTVGVSTTYTDSHEIFETSPATGAAWLPGEVNEFGIELVQ